MIKPKSDGSKMLRKKTRKNKATTSFNHKLLEVYFSAIHYITLLIKMCRLAGGTLAS